MEIVTYDAKWPGQFEAETERLRGFLPSVEFHHVGSTAVPGLSAKPIIDMMAVVPDLDVPTRQLVKRSGYDLPEARYAGTEMRQLCRGLNGQRTHNLTLTKHRDVLNEYLRLRDSLRNDDWLRLAYDDMKRHLAGHLREDAETYLTLKSDLFNVVFAALDVGHPPSAQNERHVQSNASG